MHREQHIEEIRNTRRGYVSEIIRLVEDYCLHNIEAFRESQKVLAGDEPFIRDCVHYVMQKTGGRFDPLTIKIIVRWEIGTDI